MELKDLLKSWGQISFLLLPAAFLYINYPDIFKEMDSIRIILIITILSFPILAATVQSTRSFNKKYARAVSAEYNKIKEEESFLKKIFEKNEKEMIEYALELYALLFFLSGILLTIIKFYFQKDYGFDLFICILYMPFTIMYVMLNVYIPLAVKYFARRIKNKHPNLL